MISRFLCKHCGKIKERNTRIKQGQKFCGSHECQKARRRLWKKTKYSTNPTYRQKQLESQQRWRDNHPVDEYQRVYRSLHLRYTDRNRLLQRDRNKKRRASYRLLDLSQKIVNGNAFSLNCPPVGFYAYIPAKFQKIVNGNALLITMHIESQRSITGTVFCG